MTYEKLESCPICSHTKFENYLICEDYSVSGESFALVKCDKCKLVFTNPRPSLSILPNYYKSEEYISHTDKGNSPLNILYKLVRKYTLSWKFNLIQKYAKPGTLLDYGCGTGDFLLKASRKDWVTFGLEPDKEARKIAQAKNEKQIHESIADLKEKVDVITAWHVIEHVYDLLDTLKKLKDKMNKGGYIFLAVPNHKSFDATFYNAYWAAYDVPRHLYHFDQESMSYLIKKLKFELMDTIPMKLDSYYVSLLSEKYKNGSFLNALSIGYKSNQKASKTGEYSSLIYVLKK